MSHDRFHRACGHLWGVRVGAFCLLLASPALARAGDKAGGPKPPPAPQPASQAQVVAAYGQLPLSFEANQGQTDPQVKFLSRGRGYALFLTGNEAVLSLRKPSAGIGNSKLENRKPGIDRRGATGADAPDSSLVTRQSSLETEVLRLRLAGANPAPEVRGLDELPGKSNYFLGKDPKQWRTNVPNYAKVAYRNAYPGVDLVYYGNQGQLEYDFVVAPGADPKAIRLGIETGNSKLGTSQSSVVSSQLSVAQNGDLVIATDEGEIRLHKPLVYQPENPKSEIQSRKFLDGRFVLRCSNPKSKIENPKYEVAFEIARYDASRPLIIDPTLTYSTYLGGSDVDEAAAIDVDGSGNAYLIGDTTSVDFPPVNPEQPANAGLSDVFVTKIDTAGSTLLYSTYLGGSAGDQAYTWGGGIVVDSAGNAYLTGATSSTDFPTTVGAVGPFQGSLGGSFDAFVAKLGPTGSVLVYSTYLGGSDYDYGGGIAVDSAGNVYVAGLTQSGTDFPTANPLQASFGGGTCGAHPCADAFVARLNATGSALNYSTYLGGSADDYAFGIAVDRSGNAYVTGRTLSSDFPTANAIQAVFGGVADAFVAKLAPGGTSLLYSTYLGGSDMDGAIGITVDSSGDAYVTGWTYSSNFPMVGALQPALAGTEDAFITKINPTGSGLVYSTFLGGSDDDQGYGIDVDSFGNAYVTGYTSSTDFPTASPLQDTNAGAEDVFVAKVNSAGSALIFSTYLGGSGSDYGSGIAVDSSGDAYVAGATASTDFPTTSSAYDRSCGTDGNCNAGAALAASDAFVAKLTGLALPVATLSPTSLDFGSLGVGFTSAARTVTLTNKGGSVLNVTSIVASGDFASADSTTCPGSGTVAAGTSCTIDVTFTPTATGSRTGDITITDDASGSPHAVSLTGNGVPAPAVSLSPTSLDFGSQLLGTRTSGIIPAVTLTNTGGAPLIISSISISSATGDFTIALPNTGGPTACQLLMTPDITLAVNESCRIPVQFLPTILGIETGQITITHNAPGSPHAVSLSGTGTGGPVVSLSPSSLTFASQRIGTTSAVQSVTLSNSGTAALSIASIAASSDFAQTNTCAQRVPAGTSCTIDVTFTPTATGNRTGAITITDAAPGSPHAVSLSGTGTGGPVVSLSPTSLTFASQRIGTTSAVQRVTLSNSGTAALSIASIVAGGDFAQTNTCGQSVPAGTSCTIDVTFTPTATGNRTGAITITDAAPGSPHAVSLSGTGTGGPVVSLSPSSVDFPRHPLNIVDCPSIGVTLTNTGDTPLAISSIVPSANFSETDTCGTSLAAGASCTISVQFHPPGLGTTLGTLTLTSDAPGSPHTVALSGTGTPACQLLTSVRSATVLRGTDSTSFGVSDSSPSCTPVPIELSCSLQNPAACALNPATIPPSGSSTLKVSNLRLVTAEWVTVVVNAVSEFRWASESLTVLISDFAFTRAPERATVRAGEATSYALAIRPVNGLAGTVRLSCGGAPQGATCTVAPSAVTLDGSSLGQATVRVTTTARVLAGPGTQLRPPVGTPRDLPLVLGLMSLAALATLRTRRRRAWVVLSFSLLLVLVWAACGGGGSMSTSPGSGTPAGTYMLTVRGTYTVPSGDVELTHDTTVTLTVN